VLVPGRRGGHLDVLAWLKENECPWNEEGTCSAAAERCQLEVLKWLREQGCKWDANTVGAGLRQGTSSVVVFLT